MRRITATILQLMLAAALLSPIPSHAIFGIGKKDENKGSTELLDLQEKQAMASYEKALSKEKAGKYDSARDILKDLVKDYPLTTVAAQSQFKIGELYGLDGKPSKAFEAYQTFITRYKGSALFAVAVKRQFEIATRGHKGKTNSFLGLNYKIQPSRLIEMYQSIAENAPFSEYAPLALYAVGELYASTDEVTKAVDAYQEVVADYPTDPKAAEAQYQIGQLLTAASEKGNNDQAHLRKTREAYEEFIIQFPDNELASEAKEHLSGIEAQEVAKSFQIGEFYEKKGNLKAAAIYYREVLRHPAAEQYSEAKDRLEAIGPQGAIDTESGQRVGGEFAQAVKAPYDVKNRNDYLGPPAPAPKLVAATQDRRSLRNPQNDFRPVQIPVTEPDLPVISPSDPGSAVTSVQPLLPPPNIGRPLEPTGAKMDLLPLPLPLPPEPPAEISVESDSTPEIKIIKSKEEE